MARLSDQTQKRPLSRQDTSDTIIGLLALHSAKMTTSCVIFAELAISAAIRTSACNTIRIMSNFQKSHILLTKYDPNIFGLTGYYNLSCAPKKTWRVAAGKNFGIPNLRFHMEAPLGLRHCSRQMKAPAHPLIRFQPLNAASQ